MFDLDAIRTLHSENFKQIEDIIDARKILGQYNIYKPINCHLRCVYSSRSPSNRIVKFDESSLVASEKESLPGPSGAILKRTDSEVTVVRVKCTGSSKMFHKWQKWDMLDDVAIPGDGTHLAESPSMVNLATLVGKYIHPCEGDDEYLVPLSSWDPFIKNEDLQSDINRCSSDSKVSEKYSLRVTSTDPDLINKMDDLNSNSSQTEIRSEDFLRPFKKGAWTAKIAKIRKKPEPNP